MEAFCPKKTGAGGKIRRDFRIVILRATDAGAVSKEEKGHHTYGLWGKMGLD